MNDWSGVRKVAGPVALALLVTAQLAAFGGTADAHGRHRAQPAPVPPVVHNHGAATVTPLTRDCSGTALEIHDGFQEAPTCAETAFGEVPAQQNGASLLIVDAPRKVRVGEPITLKVSTRNLIRDRFLAAGQGGYYLESSLLNGDGLVRGHFHTSCALLPNEKEAPPPDRAGDGLFLATEDGGGSATPDVVTVTLPGGLPAEGTARCMAWAGDGSHRVPMEQFANQQIAVDTVRIEVRGEKKDRDRGDRRRDRKENDG